VDHFQYRAGQLHCEDVSLDEVADRFGTPCYVYSRHTLEHHLGELTRAFAELDPLVCYAVKTCGNVHLLRLLGERGAGADVVSGGELFRARTAGIPADRIVFAGVGKSDEELREAVDAGIRSVNVESESELAALGRVAAAKRTSVRAAVRVNPDVALTRTPAATTTGVRGSKFGVDLEHVPGLFDRLGDQPYVQLDGLHVHLGSPIHDPEPYGTALIKLLDLLDKLRAGGHEIRSLNAGGGFAAAYESGAALAWSEYAATIVPLLRSFHGAGGEVILEPGRSIAANAGVLVAGVRHLKQAGDHRLAVVDAGMSNLIRAALYDAFHFIWPTRPRGGAVPDARTATMHLPGLQPLDIVGPVCESTDYLARQRELPELRRDDRLCIFGAGAYGMAMASQYNGIPRPPEVLVSGSEVTLIRRRETYHDLVAAELDLGS
jgi:diaminopimelate decarboxylase